MFEIPVLNVDKFVHAFIKNLGLNIQSPVCRNLKKIRFIAQVEKAGKIRCDLLCVAEKMIKNTAIEQNRDFSDEKNFENLLQRRMNFLSRCTNSNDRQLLTSHLKTVNKKIVQIFNADRCASNYVKRNLECKLSNKNETWKRKVKELSPKLNNSFLKRKEKETAIYCNTVRSAKEKEALRYNARPKLTRRLKKEIQVAQKFLSLCINDVEFIKKNVYVTLYIEKGFNDNNKMKDDRLALLCEHALLYLIEPSERAFVFFEDNLSIVTKKQLSQGAEYQFNFQRNSRNAYTALLILSNLAKCLVKRLDMTMMRTISGILKCDIENILVLSCRED